jgi:uncharacterized protein (DUF2164 family)
VSIARRMGARGIFGPPRYTPVVRIRAEALLDFFVNELGPPVYNQGVRDAAGYLQQKLADIEGDVYEREPRL